MKRRSFFITFEGTEGCGKSTQVQRLVRFLRKEGREVIVTREPGGTVISEKVRKILLDVRHKSMIDITELFLYMAARSQLVQEVIIPALHAGKIVVCDRFLDATLAYQGYAGKVPLRDVLMMGRIATQHRDPDLTLLLDINVKRGLERVGSRPDRLEQKTVRYHSRVRKGYLALAKAYNHRMVVVPAGGSVEDIHETIKEIVRKRLGV